MFVFIFLFLSFQNFLCFCQRMWDESLGFYYEPLVGRPYNLKRKDSLVLQKRGKKKEYPTTCAWRYTGKGVVLSRLTYIWPQKEFTLLFGTYKLLTWKNKGEIALEPKDKHEKQMPPPPINLQRYKICMFWEVVSSMLWGSLKLWNAINRVLLNPHSKKDSQSPQISTISSAIVRWLPSFV